jgi:hypothetical protein
VPALPFSPFLGRGRLMNLVKQWHDVIEKLALQKIFMPPTNPNLRAEISRDSNFPLCRSPTAKQIRLYFSYLRVRQIRNRENLRSRSLPN